MFFLFVLFRLHRKSKSEASRHNGWCARVCLQAWESDEAIEEDMPESPGAEKHDKEKEHRDSKKGRGTCVSVCDTHTH